jgi:hypothetical protein
MSTQCFKPGTSLSQSFTAPQGRRVFFTQPPPRTESDGLRVGYLWKEQTGLPRAEPRSDHVWFIYSAKLTRSTVFSPLKRTRGEIGPTEALYRAGLSYKDIREITPLNPAVPCCDTAQLPSVR